MVNLKYVDNPFDEEMMNSISCFSEERCFYDCINRQFLDEPFEHLEHSFYTYLLTGDKGEWIGYVLFSNENRVNGYFNFACDRMIDLLNYFKIVLGNSFDFEHLEKLIEENRDTHCISMILEETLSKLKQISGVSEELLDSYNEDLQKYLFEFPEYFYLDVVITLPVDEIVQLKKDFNSNINILIEQKHPDFISESIKKAQELIKENFKDIPIFLRKDNQTTFLINGQSLNKNKIKQIS